MTTAGGASGVEVALDTLRRGARALEAAAPTVAELARSAGSATGHAAGAAGHPAPGAALAEVAQRCDTGLAALAARLDVAGLLLRSAADGHERNDDEGSLLFRGPPPPPR